MRSIATSPTSSSSGCSAPTCAMKFESTWYPVPLSTAENPSTCRMRFGVTTLRRCIPGVADSTRSPASTSSIDGDVMARLPLPGVSRRPLEVFSYNRKEYAGYVQQQGRFFDGHLLVTGGFRVDGNSQFGKEVSPAWSVALPFDEYGVTLRGSYAEGFQAPTFDELYFPGFGNPNLKAMTSSEYDGGIEKRFGEFASITTTYFSRRIHNLIDRRAVQIQPCHLRIRLPADEHRPRGRAGS